MVYERISRLPGCKKNLMKTTQLLELIMQKYWEDGYLVKEFILPLEWYKEIRKYENFKKQFLVNRCEELVKLFPSQSRHFQAIVEEYK